MSIEGLADALLAPVALKRLTVESEARNAVPDAGSGPIHGYRAIRAAAGAESCSEPLVPGTLSGLPLRMPAR